MTMIGRALLAGALLAAIASPAQAQLGEGRTSFSISANAPTGDFEGVASMGAGFSMRTPFGDPRNRWSARGGLNLDYFGGKAPYKNVQMFGFGIEVVHRSSENVYQFLGVMQSSTKYALKSTAPSSNVTTLRSSSDLGVGGGLGVNFKQGDSNYFIELAVTNLFTDATNSVWFPIKLGVRF